MPFLLLQIVSMHPNDTVYWGMNVLTVNVSLNMDWGTVSLLFAL